MRIVQKYGGSSLADAQKLQTAAQRINQLARQYENDHVKRRDAGKCAVETNVIFVEMMWELEKLGDHLANIAMRTPKIQEHYVEME